MYLHFELRNLSMWIPQNYRSNNQLILIDIKHAHRMTMTKETGTG